MKNTVSRRLAYMILGLLAFMLFILVRVPLSALTATLDPRFSVAASGTLSNGMVSGYFFGETVGRVQLSLTSHPGDLLDLHYNGRFVLSGKGISGAGTLGKGLFSATTLTDTRLTLAGGDWPLTGSVTVTLERAVIDNQGRCRSLSGTLDSDVLENSRAMLAGWTGPAISGVLHCEDGVIVIRASGARGSDRLTLKGRLGVSGSTLMVRFDTENAVLRAALTRFGFHAEGSTVVAARWNS